MAESDLLTLREEFTRRKVLVCFNGLISHGIIEEIGTAVRRYLESDVAKGAAAHDVFAIYIEFSQNMKAYLQRRAFDARDRCLVTILVRRDGDRYEVTAGNVVANEDLPALLARVEALAGMDRAALRAMHKQRLREGPSPSGGAGVGLIDVARRSAALRCTTWPVDADHTLFGITATV